MNSSSFAERFFQKVVRYPKLIIALSLLFILGIGSQIPNITIDTSIEAFIPPGHHSLVNREQVREVFGLSDPIVIAVTDETANGIFTPALLNVVAELSDKVQEIEGVDPDKITSLATQNNIYGLEEQMVVERFLEGHIQSQEQANAVRAAVMDFPLYVGNIVSEDATTTLIVVELLDKHTHGKQAYFDIKKLCEDITNNSLATVAPTASLLVAGEGGVVAYQAAYIDQDAKKMTPLAFLTVILVLLIAYRTFRGLYISLFVIIGAIVAAMGIMAMVGVPMYLTSNIIPVILIAISVADAIHILGQYYEEYAKAPHASAQELTVATMKEMWKPVTITSITDVFGFMAMGFSSYLPPLKMVGVFSSVGVIVALILSLFLVPSILVLLKPKHSKAFRKTDSSNGINTDIFGRIMQRIGNAVLHNAKMVIVCTSILFVIGGIGITQVVLDEASIEIFHKDTDIYKADGLINSKMDGSNSFDIMVETTEREGLFAPERLRKIEALQKHLSTYSYVGGTTSIVDFIKQMNKSLNENREEAYSIPNDKELIAQYFLLYSASGDPSDLEKYIDYDYRLANVKVTMKDGHYSAAKSILEPLDTYLTQHFNEKGLHAKIAGWMNVFYYWLDGVPSATTWGSLLALLLIWILTSLSFRSAVAGVLAVIPVIFSLVIIFAIMGYTGITLSTATSIFAVIAIGVTVDFAVHIIDRLIHAVKAQGRPLHAALSELYPSTGRALLFNFSAVALGFGINMTSSLPPFIDFGMLITASVVGSFVASMTLLPAMIKLLNPKFLTKL